MIFSKINKIAVQDIKYDYFYAYKIIYINPSFGKDAFEVKCIHIFFSSLFWHDSFQGLSQYFNNMYKARRDKAQITFSYRIAEYKSRFKNLRVYFVSVTHSDRGI